MTPNYEGSSFLFTPKWQAEQFPRSIPVIAQAPRGQEAEMPPKKGRDNGDQQDIFDFMIEG